jgi:hypothetical protein
MKTLQALFAACALSALPLYAAGVSALPYATADGEVGIPDWQPPKL